MDKATIDHLCSLSKLDFAGDELERIIAEMSSIVGLMDKITEIDLSYDDLRDNNSIAFADLREDEAAPSLQTELLLQNAKSSEGFFVVPKVIE